eukprot:TRINITY_DN2811_c0_g1_i2.p1 TRINITY_DN2811_c0_g1~~TRINITY_DN2811_c0_g1_i2.p1  ORF type:complete len:233 (-),score=91.10 TRINITY_DN2811_c0_g1_i2:46-693(-)
MSRFEAYENNGGTVLAVAGKDYAVIASDTRMSRGYSITCRDATKMAKLTDKCVIASAGMQADASTLHKVLYTRLTMYQHQHRKPMQTIAIAQMLSNMLYHKRFFPYYTFNLVAGVDENGEGCVFGYDAIGSYERLKWGASGSGEALIQPLLDNQVGFTNQTMAQVRDLPLEETLDLIKDGFTSAGERDIYTGDSVEIAIITKDGVRFERFELKRD